MAKPLSFGRFEVGLTAGTPVSLEPAEPDAPMRILLLGDFSGHTADSAVAQQQRLRGRKPLVVDRDNLDKVLAKLNPEARLNFDDAKATLTIRFSELEDFHPDRLYQRVGLFKQLKDLRERLGSSSSFAAAAAEVQQLLGAAADPPPAPPSQGGEKNAAAPPQPAGNLLDQVLAATTQQAQESPADAGEWQRFLRRIVAPHQISSADLSKQAKLVELLDQAIGAQMRDVLHHPRFQALEAAWRSVYFLVRRLDTDANLKLFLLDVTRDEVAADLAAEDLADLTQSELYRILVEETVRTPGGQPWGLIAGLYNFDYTQADAVLLARLAALSRQAGAPFLAEAHAHLVGAESLHATPDARQWNRQPDAKTEEAWTALRGSPAAASLGLALPRFILRLPYGKLNAATQQFEFEEMSAGTPKHEHYLWGNPAVAITSLIAGAYSRTGWDFSDGIPQEIAGLPLHVYDDQGDKEVKPCAEVVFNERAVEAIIDRQIMPLLSMHRSEAVRLGRFQSIAEPATPLAGRWRY